MSADPGGTSHRDAIRLEELRFQTGKDAPPRSCTTLPKAAPFSACRKPSYIGDVRQREASSPVAVLRSRSATSRPACP